MNVPVIKLKHLKKEYSNQKGIHDVCLTVMPNDFYGFIGPNGAGKSTTIRTLLGLMEKDGGEASILSRPAAFGQQDILKDIGYMPSEAIFPPGFKVKDVLNLSASLHQKDCKEQAMELCRRLDLDPEMKVSKLSLGNRKKVGIVCALQHEPSLLILDEPTSGLDPLIQKEFFSILQERHVRGVTIFLSSHNLYEVEQYCRQLAVIQDGKIVLETTIDQLKKQKAKRVILQTTAEFANLPGMYDRRKDPDHRISFLYWGDLQKLFMALETIPVMDIQISDPDLEELFLQFYQKGDEDDHL